MAVLKSRTNDLSLIIKFMEYDEDGWIHYEIKFLSERKSVINPVLLKRWRKNKNEKLVNGFRVADHPNDQLITLLEKVNWEIKPDYWQPLDPDVTLIVFPENYSPFIKIGMKLQNGKLLSSTPIKNKHEVEEMRFQIICLVDSFNFSTSGYYTDDGISLHLTVTGEALKNFIKDLKREYAKFLIRYDKEIQGFKNSRGE